MVSILCLEHLQPQQMWGIPPPYFRVHAKFCLICEQSYACSPLQPYIWLPFFQVERYTISGLHTSPVTAIEWSMNGMKMFSGDKSGLVVLTEIDFYMVSISDIMNDVCTFPVLWRYLQGQEIFSLLQIVQTGSGSP